MSEVAQHLTPELVYARKLYSGPDELPLFEGFQPNSETAVPPPSPPPVEKCFVAPDGRMFTSLQEWIEADIAREDQDISKATLWRNIRSAGAQKADEIGGPVSALDRSAEMAFYDDHGHFPGAEIGLELSDDDRRFAFSALGEFIALSKEKTGSTAPEERIAEMRKANAELLAQSHAIAEKMERAGFDAYRKTPFGLWRYFVHSRHVEKLPCFRRVTFIPHVAQSVRAPMVSALESFLERHPFARMWTVTSGPRTPLCDVKLRTQMLHGKISDLNAQPFMRKAGVEIVFRSTELGTPETDGKGNVLSNSGEIERDETGQLYFHVHAHLVVVHKKGYIPPKKWAGFLKQVGQFWGHWWKDGGEDRGGRIAEPREVCKYVTKPGEMLKLTGPELVSLHEQLKRLKLVQPMGILADEIRARKAAGMVLVKRRTPDGAVYREAKNWNRHCRRTRTEGHQDAATKLCKPDRADVLRVVSRLLPAFGPCGVAEPRVVVLASTWDETAVRRNPLVATLIAQTFDEFKAGEAIRVHTGTPTVRTDPPFDFVRDLGPPRCVPTGAELAGFSR